MAMTAKLWTLNGLAVELARDRRTLARELDSLTPDQTGKDGSGRVSRKYRMAAVVAHLMSDGAAELDANEQRARRDKEAADKLALENAETRGDVARVSVMEAELAALFADHRSNALAMPNKLAPGLVGLNAAQIRDRLERAVYELLVDLASYRPGRRTLPRSSADENAERATDSTQ